MSADATTSFWPRSSSCRWAPTRTTAAAPGGASPAVEDSLRRLSTDHIDLYQVHRPSQDIDVEETLSALTDIVRQGKIRYFGSSSYAASQIVEAQWVARDRHLERFRTEQPPYSIMVRGVESDVLPTMMRHGMGILTYSPLGSGWLSGRWRLNAATPTPASEARRALAARFDMSLPETSASSKSPTLSRTWPRMPASR